MTWVYALLTATSTLCHSLLRHAHDPVCHFLHGSDVGRVAGLDPRDVDLAPALPLNQLNHIGLALARDGDVPLADQVRDRDVFVPRVGQRVGEADRRVERKLPGQALTLLQRDLGRYQARGLGRVREEDPAVFLST